MELGHVQGVRNVKDLKIRWALHGPEWEPTSRQRGYLIFRQLQKMGLDADAWDLKSPADIIVCQYDLKHTKKALESGATVVQDVNDMVFAEHHQCHKQFHEMIGQVHAVVAGTERLGQHLTGLHPFLRVIYEPVDDRYLAVEKKKHDGLEITWSGLHDNARYFAECDAALERLAKKHKFVVNILCPEKDGQGRSNAALVASKHYPTKYEPWTMEKMLEQLSVAGIAVVPLFNNAWTMCKASNKALCYMAAGAAVVASDVSPYQAIIKHGQNGFLCLDSDDWYSALDALLTKPQLRSKIGSSGRVTARGYAVDRICQQWVELFKEIRPR